MFTQGLDQIKKDLRADQDAITVDQACIDSIDTEYDAAVRSKEAEQAKEIEDLKRKHSDDLESYKNDEQRRNKQRRLDLQSSINRKTKRITAAEQHLSGLEKYYQDRREEEAAAVGASSGSMADKQASAGRSPSLMLRLNVDANKV